MTTQNLSELIRATLAASGRTLSDFAASTGCSRTTIMRWNSALPGPDTLRTVADELGVPYRQVLQAALVGANYVSTTADLAPAPVYVVSPVGYESSPPQAAFTDPAVAQDYAEGTGLVDFGTFEVTELAPDIEPVPDTVIVFIARWDNQSGRITVDERRVLPEWQRTEVSDVSVGEVADRGIFSLSIESRTEQQARSSLRTVLQRMRDQGRLLPASVNPYPGGFTERVAEYALAQAQTLNYAMNRVRPAPEPNTRSLADALAKRRVQTDSTTPDDQFSATKEPLVQDIPKAIRELSARTADIPYQWGGGGMIDNQRGDGESDVKRRQYQIPADQL